MRKIFLLILFVNVYFNIFAQSESENMIKYWHYRNRLKYFVVPGIKQGESEVIVKRNDMLNNENDTTFLKKINSSNGDQSISFGFYLGMLATEYKLLIDNGQTNSASNTLQELDLALDQFTNWLDICEYYWGCTNAEDGFFLRENVPCDFLDTNVNNGLTVNGEKHMDLLNKNLTKTNNHWDNTTKTFGVPRGHPGYSNFIDAQMCTDNAFAKEPMSQDMAIGVLKGLALIKRFCPSTESDRSREIACNIISYIQQCPHTVMLPPATYWQIYQPVPPVSNNIYYEYQDQSPLFHSYGFIKAAWYFDNWCVNEDAYSHLMRTFWNYQALGPRTKIYNSSMAATLAAIGKSWYIGFNVTIGWCPYCIPIPLYIPATGWGIKNETQKYENESFYLLYYSALHNKNVSNYLSSNMVEDQLNGAPCEGPYDYRYDNNVNGFYAPGGWASTVRFHHGKWEHQGFLINPDDTLSVKFDFGNFTGLDYMLLYNLNHIINGGIPYENYNSRYLTGTVNSPINYVAFDSISSIQVINQTQPIVEYKAGEQVALKPGFHATHGSDFHAYIGPTGCGDNFITDSISQPTTFETTAEDACITDSLPVAPCAHDTLYFNGIDGDTTNNYTYIWYFGSSASPQTSNIKNPSVYYANPGTYNIMLDLTDTTTHPNTNIRLCIIIVKPACDSSGGKKLINKPEINPSGNYQVSIFPNPSTGIFNVSCSDNSLSYSIEVSDVIGNNIYNVNNATGPVQFDLSYNPKGIYFVKVTTSDGKTHYRKIIHN